jgi:hypothetical protein
MESLKNGSAAITGQEWNRRKFLAGSGAARSSGQESYPLNRTGFRIVKEE